MQKCVNLVDLVKWYLLEKIGFDTAENDPSKVCYFEHQGFSLFTMTTTIFLIYNPVKSAAERAATDRPTCLYLEAYALEERPQQDACDFDAGPSLLQLLRSGGPHLASKLTGDRFSFSAHVEVTENVFAVFFRTKRFQPDISGCDHRVTILCETEKNGRRN